jgi:hypothetical protein
MEILLIIIAMLSLLSVVYECEKYDQQKNICKYCGKEISEIDSECYESNPPPQETL